MSTTSIPGPEQFGLGAGDGGKIVYVRSVDVSELGPDIETPEGVETLYALHDPSGRRLALFGDRDMAFAVAKSNELTALSAH